MPKMPRIRIPDGSFTTLAVAWIIVYFFVLHTQAEAFLDRFVYPMLH